MKGSLRIIIKDANGNLKSDEVIQNRILPTAKNKINAYLKQLDFFNSGGLNVNFTINPDTFGGITLHSTPFDDGPNHDKYQYLDIDYKIPYLIGGSGSEKRDPNNTTYSPKTGASTITDNYTNQTHFLTNNWIWNSDKDFTLSSVCLRDSNFIDNGVVIPSEGYYTRSASSIKLGNYDYSTSTYDTEVSSYYGNMIYYNTNFSINKTGKIYKDRINFGSDLDKCLHPLRNDYVIVPYDKYYNFSLYHDSVGIAIIPYDNLNLLQSNISEIALATIPYSDIDDGENYFDLGDYPEQKGLFYIIYGEKYDYLVFHKNSDLYKGLIRIYRIVKTVDNDAISFDLTELSKLDETTSSNYTDLKTYLNKYELSTNYTSVIGNTAHSGYFGNSQFELSIFDKTLNETDVVNLEYLVSYFYNNYIDTSDKKPCVTYYYKGYKNSGDDNYLDAYVHGYFKKDSVFDPSYDNGSGGDVPIYIKQPNFKNFFNQTYVNLQNPKSVKVNDTVLISYTISIGGLQDDSEEETNE